MLDVGNWGDSITLFDELTAKEQRRQDNFILCLGAFVVICISDLSIVLIAFFK